MKRFARKFHTIVLIRAVFAQERFFRRKIDEYGGVGREISDRIGVDRSDEPIAQPAPFALISERRIVVPVADHQFSRFQRGGNGVVQMLHSCRGIEKRFAFVGHFGVFTVENERAYRFRNFASARFARENVIDSRGIEIAFQHFRLRGFSAAVAAFQRNEFSFRHRTYSPARRGAFYLSFGLRRAR